MSNKVTVYFTDDEEDVYEWVDDESDKFGSKSSMIKLAVKHFKDRKEDEISDMGKSKDPDKVIT